MSNDSVVLTYGILTNFFSLIGVDQDTGTAVVIKLADPHASEEMAGILENEYHNYLQLGAEGNLNKRN